MKKPPVKKKPKGRKPKARKLATQYAGCVSHGNMRYPLYVAITIGEPFEFSEPHPEFAKRQPL